MTSDKSYATEARFSTFMNQAGPVMATVGQSPITTTGLHALAFASIAGGTIGGGERYRGKSFGTFNIPGLPSPSSVDFFIYWRGVAGDQIVDLSIPSAGITGPLTNLGYVAEMEAIWQSATELTVHLSLDWHTASGASGSSRYFSTKDVTGLSTAATNNLTLAYSFTGAALCTLTPYASYVARVA